MTKIEEYFFSDEGKEINIRGTYLMIAADVEWILSMILADCFKDNPEEIDSLYDKTFDRLTLFEKIGATQIGLIRYHPLIFKDHMDDFKQLSKLRDMRNKFAHGKIDFTNNKQEVKITEIKNTGIETNIYIIDDLLVDIKEYGKSISRFLRTIGDSIRTS